VTLVRLTGDGMVVMVAVALRSAAMSAQCVRHTAKGGSAGRGRLGGGFDRGGGKVGAASGIFDFEFRF